MNVFVLEVNVSGDEPAQALHPVILQSGEEMILVDCGYPGFLPLLEESAARQGLLLSQLTGILITHHDIDHMGALFELKEKYPNLRVFASKEDAPYIAGQKKSLRLQQAEALFECLLEAQKEGARQFQEMLKQVQPVPVDQTIDEEGELSFLKGVTVIFTPGHMPGHFSVFLPDQKILIAADALVVENGEFDIANPAFTLDMPTAVKSVRKLRQLDIEKMICYHGGVAQSDIAQKLEKLIAIYS